jgi:protease-4
MEFTRESVFVGAIRSFCKSLASVIGILIGVCVIAFVAMMVMGPNYLPDKANPMIMPDAQGHRELLSATSPAILRIDIHGVIGLGDLTGEKIQNILLDSREDFLASGRVKGILLHMDTPGGTVTDADTIYRALLDYKAKYNVPIYAYIDGLCASGGMYIISAADKVYATSVSTIGSIGVIMGPSFNFSDALSKIGVSSLTITEGKDKDMLNPFRPWKPGEDQSIRTIIANLYERFVDLVISARPKVSKEKLVNDYGAHVFLAKEAEQIGYIDGAGANYSQTLTALTQAAGIDEKQNYQVVQLYAPKPLFPDFANSLFSHGKVKHTLDMGQHLSSELSGKMLYLYQP